MDSALALGIIGDAALLSEDLIALFKNNVIPLMGLLFVALVGKNTKAFGPTLVAVIAAAVIWWATENMELLKDKTGEDLKQSAPQVVRQVEGLRPGDAP